MATAAVQNTKRFLTRNLTLKLLSLSVAVCIWSFTAISRETHYDLSIPVELRNIPPGYMITGQPLRTIHFTLNGPSILIDGARRSNAALILNLRGVAPGVTHYSHLESYLKLPEGISVTRISPATLDIELIREQRFTPQGEQQQ